MTAEKPRGKSWPFNATSAFFLCVFPLLILSACNTQPSSSPQAGSDTLAAASSTAAGIKPAQPPSNFKSAVAEVDGTGIHYVIGGTGEPLLLIHGFGQN